MKVYRGIAVFPGVAVGPASLLDRRGFQISRRLTPTDQIEDEVNRVRSALSQTAQRIDANRAEAEQRLGDEVGLIFEAHRQMVCDPHLLELVEKRIRTHSENAEEAVRRVLKGYAELFRGMSSGPFAERANDFVDLERQILSVLLGEGSDRPTLPSGSIVMAYDLTPSQVADLASQEIKGLATAAGGRTSHTAIVAGALEIPAVVGLGEIPEAPAPGEMVVIDGYRGMVVVGANADFLERARAQAERISTFEASLTALRDLPAVTKDGVEITLMGNIEFPQEAEHCVQRGASGVGLYRTEFLYLHRSRPPTEDEHYEAYSEVMQKMGPDRPVVFRTMDLGADKLAAWTTQSGLTPHEPNPMLGLRSVRLSLRNLDMFKTQLRALLRVSTLGNVRIMFPLVSTLSELRRCKMVLNDVMEDLDDEGIEYRRDIPVGMMVEVPSAAMLANQFAKNVDFFSIGTNDLIQYTLAVDRTNSTVGPLYSASDPAVLKLLRFVLKMASKHGIDVNVCGEMSGDPIYTLLLVGMGLRHMSVTPHNIPEIKKIIRSITVPQARHVAHRVRRLDAASDITSFLRNRTRHLLPELFEPLDS